MGQATAMPELSRPGDLPSSGGGTIFGRPRYDVRLVLSDDTKILTAADGAPSRARQTWAQVKNRLRQLARQPPGRVDAALAAVVVLAGLAELLPQEGGAAGVPAVLLPAAGVLLHRRRPLPALALGIAGLLLSGVVAEQFTPATPFLALIFLVFSMAARVDPPWVYVAAVATTAGGIGTMLLDPYPDVAGDYPLLAALLVAVPVAGGRLLRSRTELTRALRVKAERAERNRERIANEAVSAERTRIAGELHDVVAHALGAMTVQAAAARRLAEKDTERAGAAFQAVEATGREALSELRRLLGVLRRADEELALAPQPRLAFLGDLARRMGAAGLPVQVDVHHDLPLLPTGVDLTAYRVVQEALGEALRSGGAGRATVHVRHRGGEIEVEVLDDGRNTDRRLLGMRERVRVYGGQLEIAPRREGGHRVRARLPVGAPT